jgi:pyruvate kinase
MLESMIENPRPTRAEASDVANAVLDGADAVMLSAETSVGKYPVATVQTMDHIICRAETRGVDHLGMIHVQGATQENVYDALARSACVLAGQIQAAAIIPLTHSGDAAIRISKYRPEARIIPVAENEKILRRINLVWGLRGIVVLNLTNDIDAAFHRIIEQLKHDGLIERGDYVVFTAGLPLMAMGTTDTIKVEIVQ